MSRTKSREIAFKYIYAMAYGQEKTEDILDSILDEDTPKMEDNDLEFYNELVDGVKNNLKEIDSKISAEFKKWTIDRIFKIDLSILRLATYEILYTDISYKVAINEAVELAKKYGDNDSAKFINGVLAKIVEGKE